MKLKELDKKDIERPVNPAVSVTKLDVETQNIEIDEYVFTDESEYELLDIVYKDGKETCPKTNCEILKGEYTSLDAISKYIYEDKNNLNEKRILRNQYTYTFGLFYIKVLYKSYNAKKIDTITLNGFINNEDDVILGTLEVTTLLEENKQPLEISSNNDILSPLQIVTSIERGE